MAYNPYDPRAMGQMMGGYRFPAFNQNIGQQLSGMGMQPNFENPQDIDPGYYNPNKMQGWNQGGPMGWNPTPPPRSQTLSPGIDMNGNRINYGGQSGGGGQPQGPMNMRQFGQQAQGDPRQIRDFNQLQGFRESVDPLTNRQIRREQFLQNKYNVKPQRHGQGVGILSEPPNRKNYNMMG